MLPFILAVNVQDLSPVNNGDETATASPVAVETPEVNASPLPTIIGILFFVAFFIGVVIFFMLNRRGREDGANSLMGGSIMSEMTGNQISGHGLL